MNNIQKLFFCAMLLLPAVGLKAKVEHLLPYPQSVTLTRQRAFKLGRPICLSDPTKCALLQQVLTENHCTISNRAKATVGVTLVDSISMAFDHHVPLFPNEAYRIEIETNNIRIEAVTPTGVIRAAQTLRQLAEGYDGKPSLETLIITDWPAFKVRGFMHDVGRSFLSFAELKREIENLSRFKVNVFHWHLTENLAWRFEVNAFPELTSAKNMKRDAGLYYTQAQCRELEQFAAGHGITLIPEIDMPGHSDAFTRTMGFSMQTEQGVEALKEIIDEVVDTFPLAPYIHIGGDEVTITYPNFLGIMAGYVRSKGKKVVMWNRLVAGAPSANLCDMTQMWATSGRTVKGLPNIDCRYNYINHFDAYADVVGIYKSSIYYEQRGTDDVAGTITATWNDTKLPTQADIVLQNNLYVNVLASAERTWRGGGERYIETGGTTLPISGTEYEEFADFERRFLFHKAHSLASEPISYVRQCNVRWRITDPFPNEGDKTMCFPPEYSEADTLPDTFIDKGHRYGTHEARGAGIYLRHIWHPIVPSFYENPQRGQTAYAWTYIYSPTEQEAGAQIETYTYSRSGKEFAPPKGEWDRRGSKIWLNDEEIPAPQWEQTDVVIPKDDGALGLTNENVTARPVVRIRLKQGWNKVFFRLPYADNGGTGRDKWQFTFVITDKEGCNALDGIVYSPTKEMASD